MKPNPRTKKTNPTRLHSLALLAAGISLVLVISLVLNTVPAWARERTAQTSQATAPQMDSDKVQADSTKPTSILAKTAQRAARAISTITTDVKSSVKNMNSKSKISASGLTYATIDDLDPTLWEGGVKPYPGAPACTDHDDTAFHTLWNKEKGCHYDHTHGYDPDKTIFKDIVASWDQEISYAWQTPNENLYKHKGYVYLYTEAKDGCELGRYKNAEGCIRKLLYQIHSIGTNMELTMRFHSFRFVAEVCNLDQSECGIVQGGGQTDFGVTHCPYKNAHCATKLDPTPLPEDNGVLPAKVTIQQPPYKANGVLSNEARLRRAGRNTQFWNGFAPNPIVAAYYPNHPNQLFSPAWAALDGWTLLDPADAESGMYHEHFLCADGSCKFNHSEYRMYSFRIVIPAGPDRAVKFTTVQGAPDKNCSAASSTCAAFSASNGVPASIGTYFLDRKVNPANAPELEFDICFNKDSGEPEGCNSNSSVTSGWTLPQDTSAMMDGMMM